MQLKESAPFFHCKANYEAASRGLYGTFAAGTLQKKNLRETCPTHHKKY